VARVRLILVKSGLLDSHVSPYVRTMLVFHLLFPVRTMLLPVSCIL
jgi:hypothetical protein